MEKIEGKYREDEVISLFKDASVSYYRRLKAEILAEQILQKHGYTKQVNTHEEHFRRYIDLYEQMKKMNLDVSDEWIVPDVKIDIISVKQVLVAVMEQELDENTFNEEKNKLIDFFTQVYRDCLVNGQNYVNNYIRQEFAQKI